MLDQSSKSQWALEDWVSYVRRHLGERTELQNIPQSDINRFSKTFHRLLQACPSLIEGLGVPAALSEGARTDGLEIARVSRAEFLKGLGDE